MYLEGQPICVIEKSQNNLLSGLCAGAQLMQTIHVKCSNSKTELYAFYIVNIILRTAIGLLPLLESNTQFQERAEQ